MDLHESIARLEAQISNAEVQIEKTAAAVEATAKTVNALHETTTQRGLWIWGPPHSGKKMWIGHTYQGAYNKTIGRPWKKYDGQDVLLVWEVYERNDATARLLVEYVCDESLVFESEEGFVTTKPLKKIVVHSRLSINEMTTDPYTRVALKKYYSEVHINDAIKNWADYENGKK